MTVGPPSPSNREFLLEAGSAGPRLALSLRMLSVDSTRIAIDQHYEEFVTGLPGELRTVARDLPLLLGLSTRAGVSWSDAVAEPILLSLPILLLQAFDPMVRTELCASAQRAHMFALISALIHERLDGGIIEVDDRIDAILLAIERQRQRALAELRLLGADRNASFMAAEREARSAMAAERAVFEGRSEATLPSFVAICCGKHSLAFPATMAASVAAGAEAEQLAHVHDLILGVTLGVAASREVSERSERARAKRSWIVALAGERARTEVIAELHELAATSFELAVASAQALAAHELARWAQQQAAQAREHTQSGRAVAA